MGGAHPLLNDRAATDFPELAAVRANALANEEAEIWAASLCFSSIADGLAARAVSLSHAGHHEMSCAIGRLT